MNHEEIIEKFNEFIKKWCGDNAPHLLDSDENDGEEFREALSLKEQEIEILQKSKRDMHIEDYKKHKKIISSLQEKIEKRVKSLEKDIEKKKQIFSKEAKQCNFCGSYHGNLSNEINEMIAQKVELEEIKKIFDNQQKNRNGQAGSPVGSIPPHSEPTADTTPNISAKGCGKYLPPVGSYNSCGKNGMLCPSCQKKFVPKEMGQ
jgi:chromosome segregation ATPase